MTIRSFLEGRSAKDHASILAALLSLAFEGDDGQLDFDKVIGAADLVEEFCLQIGRKLSRIEA